MCVCVCVRVCVCVVDKRGELPAGERIDRNSRTSSQTKPTPPSTTTAGLAEVSWTPNAEDRQKCTRPTGGKKPDPTGEQLEMRRRRRFGYVHEKRDMRSPVPVPVPVPLHPPRSRSSERDGEPEPVRLPNVGPNRGPKIPTDGRPAPQKTAEPRNNRRRVVRG